ncbi:MAG: NADH-quinone oxidoreductase subunit J [Syntrophomonadaceae bacterium]|mgnify:FL=1|jgi:NADH:ubiquinone oxidoreductase subunit 6 (subunit J)
MNLNDAVFMLLALITIGSALGVVASKNIVHSALLLVVTFMGVAGLYFQMNAGFIGLVQILIYGGAISVLIIFAIMLVMDVEPEKTNLPSPSLARRMWGVYLVVLLIIALGASIWYTRWPLAISAAGTDELTALANLMLGKYVVAFEVAAILLLVAVVGAIILAKGADDK